MSRTKSQGGAAGPSDLDFLVDGPGSAQTHILFAHGAGAPMSAPWMTAIAEAVAREGGCVHRFEFAYMAARRHGGRKPPPKAQLLIPEFVRAAETVHAGLGAGQQLLVGGKSMGGRVASMAVDALRERGIARGLAAVSYPFHPPKKPETLRVAHLETLASPGLIVQGERDPLGSRDEVLGYRLSGSLAVAWIADGDHDLKGRVSKVPKGYDAFAMAARAIATFAMTIAAAPS